LPAALRPSPQRRLNIGVFRSLVDLQAAIKHFLTETNANLKPSVWTADPTRPSLP
jgi:hypothetical protein